MYHKVSRASSLILGTWLVMSLAAWGATCSNGSLKGNYGFQTSGLDHNGSPIATLGRIKSDGLGNLTGNEWVSSNGAIFLNVPLTGTYAVNSDCTGSGTVTLQGNNPTHFDLQVQPNGKTVQVLPTDPGNIQTGLTIARGNSICTNAGIKGTYGVQAKGTLVGIGEIAISGLVTFDGAGNLSGKESGSVAGNIFSGATVSGSYNIKSNCTGTASFKVTGEPTQHASLMVVSGGKQLLILETDANTVVSGTGQQ